MPLANVALTDTFDTWRTRTNQLVVISNQVTEGSLTTSGTITSTNTSATGAINVSAGFIRVQGNNFTSNQVTLTSNSAALTVSPVNSGRLGSTIFLNVVGSNSISDVSTSNIATANAVNTLNQSLVAGLLAGNNYTNQIGAASNTYANTLSVTDRAIGNSAAVSANAFAVTIGESSNNWSNTLYVSALQNANNDANSANAFAVTIGAASNTWSNTIAQNWANTRLANVVAVGPITVSWATTSGYTNATISISSSAGMQIDSLGVGTAASVTTGEIRATNNITAYYSDGRLKTIISTIPTPVEKVKQLSGVFYINNNVAESFGYGDKSQQVGVIAQDVEKVLPQIVKLAPFDTEYVNGVEQSKSGQNYKTVQYEKLIPLLIEAIKELSDEVETLKSRLGE